MVAHLQDVRHELGKVDFELSAKRRRNLLQQQDDSALQAGRLRSDLPVSLQKKKPVVNKRHCLGDITLQEILDLECTHTKN